MKKENTISLTINTVYSHPQLSSTCVEGRTHLWFSGIVFTYKGKQYNLFESNDCTSHSNANLIMQDNTSQLQIHSTYETVSFVKMEEEDICVDLDNPLALTVRKVFGKKFNPKLFTLDTIVADISLGDTDAPWDEQMKVYIESIIIEDNTMKVEIHQTMEPSWE